MWVVKNYLSRVLLNVMPGLTPVRLATGSFIGGTVLAIDRKMGPISGLTGPLIGAQLKEMSLLGGAVLNPPDPSLMPVAVILTDPAANVGYTVQLDGSASTSPDPQRLLTYRWRLLSRPSGSEATIARPDAEKTYFTADVRGDYLVELVVEDGLTSSEPTRMLITATEEGSEVDLQLEISADPKKVYLNSPLTLTLTVSNLGPGDADAVDLRATLLGRTAYTEVDDPGCNIAVGEMRCTLGELKAGDRHVVRISAQPTKVPNFDILATASAPDQLDPDPSNNEVFLRTKVLKLKE